MSSSRFYDNNGTYGGAFDNGGGGTLTVLGSTFSGNGADDGGAIDNGDNAGKGTLILSGSTFAANTASPGESGNGGDGGAIDNGDGGGTGTITISGATFSGNGAGTIGGAIKAAGHGTVAVSRSTFSANNAQDGGAIWNTTDTLTVSSSTFSANSVNGDGADIDNGDGGSTGTVWAAADIFDGFCAKPKRGTWHDLGYNIGSDGTCLNGGRADVDHGANLTSLLGPLADNGGPTETMLPLAGNPAFGVVPHNTTVALNGRNVTLCPTTDQRGLKSTPGHACDAGAVQVAAAAS